MRARVNGIEVFYRDEGKGAPIVLLHAFPLSGEMWRPQIDALCDRFRVIAPDLRGFGRTEAPAGPYGLDAMAADVIALLDALGVERFVLGGLSMGGYLAFALLRRIDRSRVQGLLLADTRAEADTDDGRANRLKMAARAETEGSGPIAEAMIGRLLGRTTIETRPEVVERVKALIRENTGTGIAGAQRAMAARPDSTALLGELSMPALVLVGEEDPLTTPGDAAGMAAALPNARCATIPKAGHLSNLERPDAFNLYVADLLDRC